MNKELNKKFVDLNELELEVIDGGGNSWQQNVYGIVSSASSGCALGALFGGPIGCFVGGALWSDRLDSCDSIYWWFW